MFNGASVSEQEFGCSYYGYEVYWLNKQVPREEMLNKLEEFKWSGLSFNEFLIAEGVKKRFPKRRNNKQKKKK